MKILVLQETDWLSRGPHIQHHLFEQLANNPSIKVTVLDYDIDMIQRPTSAKSIIMTRKIFRRGRTVKGSRVRIIRTMHLRVPYLRRISALITNFFEILRLIRKERPDIIVGYSITNGLIGVILAKLFNIPYIYHYIDILHKIITIPYVEPIARVVSRISLKLADKVLVYTRLHQNFIINEGAPPQKTGILPNCISLENSIITPAKVKEFKKKYSISSDDFVLFFMGYLYDFAGLKEIIDYYNRDVNEGKFKMKFLIVGDGGIYLDIKTHVAEINANWVIITGRIPFFEVPDHIQLADLCLLSFKINDITREITPIKIIEYMAMRKPVLSNSLPGVMMELGKNNGVIFAENQKQLVEMIGELYNKQQWLKQIGNAGYYLVRDRYELPKVIERFKKIILDLIKQKIKN